MAIQVADGFDLKSKKPLDGRIQYASIAEMKAVPEATLYDGCTAYVTATKKKYTFDSSNTSDETFGKWREDTGGGGGGGVSDYSELTGKPKINNVELSGNKTSGDLGIIDETVNNLVNYYLKTETYTKAEVDALAAAIKNSRFEAVSELPTTDIQTNVIYLVPSSDPQTSNAKDEYINLDGTTAGWELIGSTDIDLSGYVTTSDLNAALADYTTTTDLTALLAAKQDSFQFTTMPTAAATYATGKVYQFIGTTDSTYTHGYFYECKESSGSYAWEAVNVQSGGSGGGSTTKAITAAIDLGGVDAGTTYPVGTPVEDILSDMLSPTLYPTLEPPSATLSATGDRLLETGSSQNSTFTIAFSRGSINPAYGTSGYRSGEATSYTLNDTTQASNTFSKTVNATNASFQGSVAYGAGEQPKDSSGANYGTPLAAGSANTNTINFEFVDALWANTTAIATVAKLALVSKTAKQKDFAFPAQTVANPEIFDIPSDWTVTAVQVKNDLSGLYEDAASQFTVTDTTHNDAAGNSVAYKRYTFNLGYSTGARSVRVKWS